MARAGPAVRRVGAFAKDVATTAAMPRVPAGDWGHALGREHLDLLLLGVAARAGAEIVQPAKVTSRRRDGDGFAATIAAEHGTRDIAARFAVAANGSWEPAPFLSAAALPHRPSDLLAFKAHFRNSSLPPDLMPLLAFPGGLAAWRTATTAGSRCRAASGDRLQQCRRQHPSLNAGEVIGRCHSGHVRGAEA